MLVLNNTIQCYKQTKKRYKMLDSTITPDQDLKIGPYVVLDIHIFEVPRPSPDTM